MIKVISILLTIGCAFSLNAQSDSSKWTVIGSYYLPILRDNYEYTDYKEQLGANLKDREASLSIYRNIIHKVKWKYQLGFGIDAYFFKFTDLPYAKIPGINGGIFYADLIGSQYMLTLNNRLVVDLPLFFKHRNYLALDLNLGLLQYDRHIFDDGGKYSHDQFGYNLTDQYTYLDFAKPLYLKTSIDYGFDLFRNENKKSLWFLIGANTSIADGIDFYKFYLNAKVGLAYTW